MIYDVSYVLIFVYYIFFQAEKLRSELKAYFDKKGSDDESSEVSLNVLNYDYL